MTKENDNTANNPDNKPVIENDSLPQAAYVTQKCSRLASAIYAVTRFLADDEPLKSKTRTLALSLIETARNPASNAAGQGGVAGILIQLRDQLTVARDGGLLSRMNHQVLAEEITALLDRLQGDSLSFGPHVNSEYLAVDEQVESGRSRNKTRTHSSKSVSDKQESQDSSEETQPTSAKQRRRQKILGLFTDADEITVNDVTEVINGYSTKTIQRDLKALVEGGKLEKHGKRRWTSYTKA